MWQWSSRLAKAKKRAAVAAPPPDPHPFMVPDPGHPIPYVYANPDFATGPEYPNYHIATGAQDMWVDKGAKPTGWRPSPKRPPEEWGGYHRDDYQRSMAEEHQINGREGKPLQYYTRYQPALNPYWYKIPDTRVQRQVHEYDFERPFDQQNRLGERQLNGMHYSAATIGLTTSPSMSLKGMSPAFRRTSTFRLEPTQWGENTVSQSVRQGPPSAVYTAPNYTFNTAAGTYRLS